MFAGVHPNDAGGLSMTVRRAASAGAQALQIFSAKPQFYNEKIAVRSERAEAFRTAMAEAGLATTRCLVHAAYVLNTASPEAEKAERAALGLAKELERTTQLGAMGCCFHPGSALSSDLESAVARSGDAVLRAVSSVAGSARVLVENTAGAGRTVGRTPEEIAGILSRVPAELRHRTGYGLDTCHLFASGLDIASSPEALRGVLDRFCDVIGEAPAFFHLNDSEGALGSNRDRHMLIGEGRIGVEPFRWLLSDSRVDGVLCVLETPHERESVAEDDPSPDPYDVDMLRLLSTLRT